MRNKKYLAQLLDLLTNLPEAKATAQNKLSRTSANLFEKSYQMYSSLSSKSK